MMKIKFPLMKYTAVVGLLISGMWHSEPTVADSRIFGSGVDQFNMEFVAIRDAGNDDDMTGNPTTAGKVDYEYSMGKFEVSEDMIQKYNANVDTNNGLIITFDDRELDNIPNNKPATSVTWNEAARFVNWLNTSTGGFAAYKFNTTDMTENISLWDEDDDPLDYDSSNPYRSLRTNYVLPSMDEWYKAAYFDPNFGLYFNFPNASDTAPNAVPNGTDPNTAVYSQDTNFPLTGPADIMSAGGLSPYGVMGMGGNVAEWQETAFSPNGALGSSARGGRGGFWSNNAGDLSSSLRFSAFPNEEGNFLGFRVASLTVVPEPSSWVLTLMGISALLYRRRMRK